MSTNTKTTGRNVAVTMCTTAMEIVFCGFSERDDQIYEQVLENLK